MDFSVEALTQRPAELQSMNQTKETKSQNLILCSSLTSNSPLGFRA